MISSCRLTLYGRDDIITNEWLTGFYDILNPLVQNQFLPVSSTLTQMIPTIGQYRRYLPIFPLSTGHDYPLNDPTVVML